MRCKTKGSFPLLESWRRISLADIHEPDYLIVLYLRKNGNIFEAYNGKGQEPWKSAGKRDSNNNRHMRLNKLVELDAQVRDEDRIPARFPIEKMKKEYKNK